MIESIDRLKHLHTHVHLYIATFLKSPKEEWYIFYFIMQFQYVIIVAINSMNVYISDMILR